jgi:F-type H+-transporting ATPase subunit a
MATDTTHTAVDTGTADHAVETPGAGHETVETTGFTPPTLASETIGHIGSFELRNTLLMAWLAMAVLIIFSVLASRTRWKRKNPGRFQTFVEMMIGGLYDFFDSIVQDAKQTRMFFPLVATILIFVVLGNWMGILPGVGSITVLGMHDGHEMRMPIFRSMNADVNMTLAIAMISMISVQVFGAIYLGVRNYSGKFIIMPWKTRGIEGPINTFVGLLEIIGELSRTISFTFRLFGNIFAGEVLLVVMSFLMPYLAPVPFLGLELFVGLVQGLVFSMLTVVFLKMAITAHGDHGHDGQAAHA